jgi:hypothetical protein
MKRASRFPSGCALLASTRLSEADGFDDRRVHVDCRKPQHARRGRVGQGLWMTPPSSTAGLRAGHAPNPGLPDVYVNHF